MTAYPLRFITLLYKSCTAADFLSVSIKRNARTAYIFAFRPLHPLRQLRPSRTCLLLLRRLQGRLRQNEMY